MTGSRNLPERDRHVFFATIDAGGGHTATARAMADAVAALHPAFRTSVSDYMLALGFEREDRRHKELWRWMLARPWTARWGQRLLDRLPAATRAYHRRFLDGVARRAAEHLGHERPDLVVVNHGWLAVALTRSQRKYGLALPVVTFATEPLDASALWAEPAAERFVTPSRAARDDLVRMGVPAGRIDVIGYPIQGAFLEAPSRADARAHFEWDDRFTVLVSLGGEGIGGSVRDVVDALLRLPEDPRVVVVTGRNPELRTELERIRHPHLVVRGFVDDMARHLAACDVMVGKAGPASVMEALAVRRPVLVTAYAGLNERKIVRYLEARRFGRYVPTPAAVARAVREEAGAPTDLGAAPDFRAMTADLADYLAVYADSGAPPRTWRSTGIA